MEEKQKGLKTQAFVAVQRDPVLVSEFQCVLGLLLWELIDIGSRPRWLAQEGAQGIKLVLLYQHCSNSELTVCFGI